jgi:hypothetical protein
MPALLSQMSVLLIFRSTFWTVGAQTRTGDGASWSTVALRDWVFRFNEGLECGYRTGKTSLLR